ncbi:MAG: hypothetical protein KatS3mg087_2057 [Patescibacteria group bacterium]|nr:MAG: hypothetical protein KatS3mg087_2057 [Patescibacteria group bacterium]
MPLPDKTLYSQPTSRDTGINSVNVNSGGQVIGAIINNDIHLDLFADIEAIWSYTTAPTADKRIEIHLLYARDGTNFEELSPNTVVAGFSPPADTSQHQRMIARAAKLLPYPFKVAVKNVDTAQSITITIKLSSYSLQHVD